MSSNQIKSKERVRHHAEVFTNEREVEAMCDLVNDETQRIDSRFLEPACGDGNFLAEILKRKLFIVKTKYKKSHHDYEKQSLLALSSLYGIDILYDNVERCKKRLYSIWNDSYRKICKLDCDENVNKTAIYILQNNIVHGNALNFMLMDEKDSPTTKPIKFSEWAFITNDMLQQSDYYFANMVSQDDTDTNQINLFETLENGNSIFLKKIIKHYKRIFEND